MAKIQTFLKWASVKLRKSRCAPNDSMGSSPQPFLRTTSTPIQGQGSPYFFTCCTRYFLLRYELCKTEVPWDTSPLNHSTVPIWIMESTQFTETWAGLLCHKLTWWSCTTWSLRFLLVELFEEMISLPHAFPGQELFILPPFFICITLCHMKHEFRLCPSQQRIRGCNYVLVRFEHYSIFNWHDYHLGEMRMCCTPSMNLETWKVTNSSLERT